MVNKKLTFEDEEQIYLDWLKGMTITHIAGKYPVVVSTVQRVVKKMSRTDGSKRNHIMSLVFKHLKNAIGPMELAVKNLKENNESLHAQQHEFLMEFLNTILNNVEMMKEIQSQFSETN